MDTNSSLLPGDLFPVPVAELPPLVADIPTPFHLYHEEGIRQKCRTLNQAFSWSPGYNNFFAVKATPNPHIMKIIAQEGFGMDCSSLAELLLCEACGISGEKIMFTSNNTPLEEYIKAKELGAILNLDDISHIEFLHENIGLPNLLCFRYNPGATRSGNVIIGQPKEAKFGLTREQIFDAITRSSRLGVKRFGLHTMIVSNCLEANEFVETARMMFELATEVSTLLGVTIQFVNLGGGFGVAYNPGELSLDVKSIGHKISKLHQEMIISKGLDQLQIYTENGRYISCPNGCLVTRIIHQKNIYKKYIGVDACMANLMRPAIYRAYHHISVVPWVNSVGLPSRRSLFLNVEESDNERDAPVYDVIGGLCENNDKFAIDRKLGSNVLIGDYLIIHDTGAHGHAMGFNYNGKLRSAEYLLKKNGKPVCIRHSEKYENLFATLDFPGLPGKNLFFNLVTPSTAMLMTCVAFLAFTFGYSRRS